MDGATIPAARRPRNLIGGTDTEPHGSLGEAVDPSTEEPIGELPESTPADAERAAAAAFAAWGSGEGPYSRLPLEARIEVLHRFADVLDERADAFAYWHAREIGIPIATTRLFAAGLGEAVRGIADAAAALATRPLPAGGRRVEVHRLPWGPAALYTAWNAPAFLAAGKIAYALAAGCPAILKPSEHAGATTGLVVDALLDAEPGAGAVQVVCGGAAVGGALAGDPRVRMISYTGGTAGGRAVAAAASGRMAALHLELSASNPAIVLRDADVETAAAELARGATVLNGQWCEAPRRVYVDQRIHDDLSAAILEELRRRTLGDPLRADTDIGPLVNKRQRAAVIGAVERIGANGTVERSHADLPERGCWFAPTIVSGLSLDAVEGEIFGPVLALSPFADLDEAVNAANALGDGLAGYVFGADRDETFALGLRLHAGEVRLGGTRVLDLAPGSTQSFWGTSGVGGHGVDDVLRAHTGTRVVGEEDRSLAL
jgi:betaine-aldehyde dehydrogenase